MVSDPREIDSPGYQTLGSHGLAHIFYSLGRLFWSFRTWPFRSKVFNFQYNKTGFIPGSDPPKRSPLSLTRQGIRPRGVRFFLFSKWNYVAFLLFLGNCSKWTKSNSSYCKALHERAVQWLNLSRRLSALRPLIEKSINKIIIFKPSLQKSVYFNLCKSFCYK